MANYNPFDEQEIEKKRDQNWFAKTATQGAFLAGTAAGVYGLWKIKGPARKILENVQDGITRRFFAQATDKASDNFDEILNKRISAAKRVLMDEEKGIGANWDIDVTDAWKYTNPEASLVTTIRSMEDNILTRGEVDISISQHGWRFRGPSQKLTSERHIKLSEALGVDGTHWDQIPYIMRSKVKLKGSEAEQFARLRQQVILEYIDKYGANTEADVGEILTEEMIDAGQYFSGEEYLTGKPVDEMDLGGKLTKRINTIHDSYMSDKKYADLYYKRLRGIHSRYMQNSFSYQGGKITRKPKIKLSGSNFRTFLYGNISEEPFKLSEAAVTNANEDMPLWDSTEARNVMKRITSDSEMGMTDGVTRLKKLSEIEYTPYLNRLKNVLNAAKDEYEDTGLKDFGLSVESFGSGHAKQRYLKITLIHKNTAESLEKKRGIANKYLDPIVIKVPLATDGRLPGSSPGMSDHLGYFHMVGNVFGTNEENMKIVHSSELILHNIIDRFEGSAMSGLDSFRDNPKKFQQQIGRMTQNMLQRLPLATGAVRDYIRLLAIDDHVMREVLFPPKSSTRRTRQNLSNFVRSARNMDKIKRRDRGKSAVITLDLEGMTNKRSGPQWMPRDETAQWTRAGLVSTDLSNHNLLLNFDEIHSDHGYNFFNEIDQKMGSGRGFNDQLNEWLKQGVLPEPNVLNPKAAYREMLDKGIKAGRISQLRDNHEFFQQLKIKISNEIDRLRGEGYDNIHIATKNGDEFDLTIMEKYVNDPAFMRKIRETSIDVQSLHYARKTAYFQAGSLKQEKVVQAMMGRLGIPEDEVAQLIRGKGNRSQAMASILKKISKKNVTLSSNLYRVLGLNQEQLGTLVKKDMITNFHIAPVLDSLYTAALLGEEYASFCANDPLYQAVDTLGLALDATNRPRNVNELMSYMEYMDRKVIPGYGVISFSAVSHGMASQLIGSMLHLSDLLPFADNPLPKQWNQMTAQTWMVKPNTAWFGKDKSKLLRAFRPVVSVDIGKAINNMQLPGATDLQNFYSNTVISKHLYLFNPYAGKEGMFYVTDKFLKEFGLQKDWSIRLDQINETDPHLANNIQLFAKEQEKVLKEWGIPLVSAKDKEWEAAAEVVANKPGWDIDFDTEVLSASKFGGDISVHKKNMRGKILNVIRQRDQLNPRNTVPRLTAKIRSHLTGDQISALPIQARLVGSKAVLQVVKTFADGSAYGIPTGFNSVSEADFFKKTYVGATKDVFFNSLIYDIYDKLNGTGITDKERTRLNRVLQVMQRKLNAQADPQNWEFKIIRNKALGDVNKKMGAVDAFMEYINNTDLRISDLARWARQTGKVWNKEEIKDIKGKAKLGEVFDIYRRGVESAISDIDDQIRNNDGVLKGLDGKHTNMVKEELDTIKMLLTPEVGSAKFFLPAKIADDQYALGLPTYQAMSLYGIEGRNTKMMDSKFRRDYMLALKNSGTHVAKSTIEYVKRSVYADRFAEYKSALKTHQRFKDALLGKFLAKKPLNLEQLKYVIDRDKRLAESAQKYKMGSTFDYNVENVDALAKAKADMELLREQHLRLETDPIYRELVEMDIAEVTNLLNEKDALAFSEALKNSSRFYTATDVEMFEKLAKENGGIVSLDLSFGQGNNPLVLDLEEEIRKTLGKVSGASNLTKNDIGVLGRKVVDYFKDASEFAKKHSKDGLTPNFKFEDGKLYLKNLVMPWDPMRSNVFNRIVTGRLYMTTPETAVKMDVMKALYNFQEARAAGAKKYAAAQESNLKQEILRFLMIGLPAEATSKFWMAGQYGPRGKWTQHMGIEPVQSRALWALEGDGRLQHMFGKGKRGRKVRNMLRNIVKSDMNTVLVTQSWLKSYRFTRHDGTEISYLRHLEENLGAEMAYEIKNGLRELPGGFMYRFPITQAGGDGLLDIKMLAIPDEISQYLGMDANTFYAHSILSGLQKWDNDGDQGMLHLKEIGTISTFNEYAREGRASLRKVLENPKLKNIMDENRKLLDENGNLVREGKIKIGAINQLISQTEGGKSWISTYDPERGVMNPKMVDSARLDFTDVAKQTKALVEAIVNHTPTAMNQNYMKQVIASQYTPMVSKHLIPVTTNILKKRTHQLLSAGEAGLIKNPRAVMDFVGNLKHGLTGIAQSVIDFGKHGDPESAARYANALQYFTDPVRNQRYREDMLHIYKEQFKDYINAPAEDLLEEQFRVATGEIENFERLSRLSQDYRTFNNQMSDLMMGRSKASMWDWMRMNLDQEFDDIGMLGGGRPYSPLRELGDTFKNKVRLSTNDVLKFKRGGKYAAIGAAALLGLSFFRPFGGSKSLNPVDMFIDMGVGIDGNHNIIHSDTELPGNVPLDMVNASFSKEAYIRMKGKRNANRENSSIINSLLRNSMLARPTEMYEFRSKPNITYSNYTTNVSRLGTMDLDRRTRAI